MKLSYPFTFLLGLFLFVANAQLEAQISPSRTTSFLPNAGGALSPVSENKIVYDEQGRPIRSLEFIWNETGEKLLQREIWIEFENEGELSFNRTDDYNPDGSFFSSHFKWFDEQQRIVKDSMWIPSDTANPTVSYRFRYEENEQGEILRVVRDIWLSTKPEWSLNRQEVYEYNEEGCLSSKAICFTNEWETNCNVVYYEYRENCELKLTTIIASSQVRDSTNVDGSERYQLTSRWDRPTRSWVPSTFKTIYYDQWGQDIGYFSTNLRDSMETELIQIKDEEGRIIYGREGTRFAGRPWFYNYEYELIEDSDTLFTSRRYTQWEIEEQEWRRRTWEIIEKEREENVWFQQTIDSSLVNGTWQVSTVESKRYLNYYCNELLQGYEEYLGWADLSQALEKVSYAYQVSEVACQGTPSPESMILYPNLTTDFLTFRS